MPNKHATESITWHPKDPTLKPWIQSEAERREATASAILDEACGEYRARHESPEEHHPEQAEEKP